MRQIRHLRIIVWVIGMAAILMGFVQSALGQTPFPSDDEVNVIARQLYCPVCENIPLDVCGTKVCAEWREVIREKLAQGWTENQINDYFVQQYGDQVLAKPPRRGINWLLYMLPPVVILGGIFLVIRMYRTKRESVPISRATEPEKNHYIEKMEEELRRRKE